MANLQGSQTEKNLLTAFAGESQARNRYTYFASKARKEGYRQIAEIFEETANQEREHAKRLFKLLEGGEAEITASFPAGVIADTITNLGESAGGRTTSGPRCIPVLPGLPGKRASRRSRKIFESIAIAEKQHEKRYNDLAANIEAGKVFKRDQSATWRCRNCGYLHEGNEAPDVCPACVHPQAHFELLGENY